MTDGTHGDEEKPWGGMAGRTTETEATNRYGEERRRKERTGKGGVLV